MRTILLASVALLGLIAPATGQTILSNHFVNLGANPANNAGIFVSINPGADFTDRMTFTLDREPSMVVTLLLIDSRNIIDTASLIWEGADRQIGGGDDVLWAGPFFVNQWLERTFILPAGDYHLLVQGDAAAPTHYAGHITAAPGPIAGSGFLALLGFGALWRRFRRAA